MHLKTTVHPLLNRDVEDVQKVVLPAKKKLPHMKNIHPARIPI